MRLRTAAQLCLLLFLGRGIASARAEENERAKHALELGHQALVAYEAGKFAEARDTFSAAEKEAHSPVFLLYSARASRALGQPNAADASFAQAAEEVLPKESPRAWQKAREDARTERAQLREENPVIGYTIEEPVTLPARLISPESSEALSLRTGTLLAPQGITELTLEDAAGRRLESIRSEKEGRPFFAFHHKTPRASVGAIAPRTLEKEAPPPAPESVNVASKAPLYTAFAFASLGAIGSLAFGGLALSEINEVKSRCVDGYCRPEDAPLAATAETHANLATVGAAVFLTGAATGVFLLLWSSDEKASLSVDARGTGLRVRGEF